MSDTDPISLRLFRFDPDADEAPRYEVHSIPRREHMRVLDALIHAYDTLDDGIAHRWYCGTKKCGECAITVNGCPMLACWEPAVQAMTCEPLTNFPIVRDLVVDTAPYERVTMGLRPYLERSGVPEFPERIRHSDMAPAHRLSKCIECNVCTAATPVKRIGPDGVDWTGYSGAAALVRFARFVLDPRDETDRHSLAEASGLATFPAYAALEGICPQGIDIVDDALAPARRKLFGGDGNGAEVVADEAATTVFVSAGKWSAFVRLADRQLRELEQSGAIEPRTISGIDRAYALVES